MQQAFGYLGLKLREVRTGESSACMAIKFMRRAGCSSSSHRNTGPGTELEKQHV